MIPLKSKPTADGLRGDHAIVFTESEKRVIRMGLRMGLRMGEKILPLPSSVSRG
ncbi:MAG: hypothetical protein ACI9X4_000449 [Glaciecola sp.]